MCVFHGKGLIVVVVAVLTIGLVGFDARAETAETEISENLVENAGFEVFDVNGFAEGWVTREYNPTVNISVDGNVARSGVHSLRLEGVGQPGVPRGRVSQRVQLPVVTAGTPYKVTGWFQTEGLDRADSVEMRLTFRTGTAAIDVWSDPFFQVLRPGSPLHKKEGGHLIHIYPDALPESGWKKIEAVVTTPIGASHLNVELFIWRAVGTVWWDDIAVVQVER